MKVKTSKGFTLAELLIVMAIIVVLAAVAIPTFGRQLETARETGDMEIIRSAYTEALAMAVLDASDGKLDGKNGGTTLVTLGDAEEATKAPTASTTAVISGNKISSQDDVQVKYVVTFAKMDEAAKIKQTGAGWQYVNNLIAGKTVPNVIGAKSTAANETDSTKCMAFVFRMDIGADSDGNVTLLSMVADKPTS